MIKKKILVLGNDPQINEIQFSRLLPDIETFGVNRIFLAHTPDYFFFQDPEIFKELDKQPQYLDALTAKSKIFTSDWFIRNGRSSPPWAKVISRSHQILQLFPDSVTTGIRLLSDNFIDRSKYTFYVAGVGLNWSEPSHFWKQLNYPGLNTNGKSWYDKRFIRIIDNFKRLKSLNFEIVSVHPHSQLNRYFRYESIGNLYSKEKS